MEALLIEIFFSIFVHIIEVVCAFPLQALGNLYFIHECVEDVMIYDFIGKPTIVLEITDFQQTLMLV